MARKRSTSTRKTSASRRSGDTCLTCKETAIRCGLCEPCYQAAYRFIRMGLATRDELEAEGLILPAKRGGISPWAEAAVKALRDGRKAQTNANAE
jgi:hypothetical protein